MKPIVILILCHSLITLAINCNQGNSGQTKNKANLAQEIHAKPGEIAPDFTLTDASSQSYTLSNYKGKYVILEWTNYGCPCVQSHYKSKLLPEMQEKMLAEGAVWFSICSSAKGKEGHLELSIIDAKKKELGAQYTAYLVDEDGQVGMLYGAKATPHMYVIDPEMKLIYMGAIDDNPNLDPYLAKYAKNFVTAAYNQSKTGEKVKISYREAYGCDIKYKNVD